MIGFALLVIKKKMVRIIKKQSGSAFILRKNQVLKVIDPNGEQVSDMVLFNHDDIKEKISSGKTFDFEESILISKGNYLWSNRSRRMVQILEDTNGRNDFLLAPCSKETFEIMYDFSGYHPSCFENLSINLESFGINQDDIPTAFNIFMNVQFGDNGKLNVCPPTSKPNDYIEFKALMDVIVGLTACSAEDSNNGSFKDIHYEIR